MRIAAADRSAGYGARCAVIPWIQVYSNLTHHPKTSRLADELGLANTPVSANTAAAGILVSLWTWAVQNAYDGDLSRCSVRTIAEECGWRKKPETLMRALINAGFLDADMRIHDWEEYAVLLMDAESEKRRKVRERVARYRERQRAGSASVTVTPAREETAPSRAVTPPQDRTAQDDTVFFGGGVDASAGGKDTVDAFARNRDADPTLWLGVTPELLAEADELAEAAFRQYSTRRPDADDRAQVFAALRRSVRGEDGAWTVELPTERKELLLYAFEAASRAGRGGDWNYIGGVLDRLARCGIRTLREAEERDAERAERR